MLLAAALSPDVQAAGGLGVDRPRCGDGESGLDQPGGQRVPGAGGLVREHQRHDAVRLQHPAALGEDRRHPCLVVLAGEGACAGLTGELGWVGDRLVLLVCELLPEQLGEQMPGGPLEPDVEEVRQLGVHDVVVVRRVHDHGVDAVVREMVETVRRFAGDRDRRR